MKAICLAAALASSMLALADSAKTDFPVELLGDLDGMSLPRTSSATTGKLVKDAANLIIATKTQTKAKKRCLHAVGELLEIVDKSDFTQLCRDYGYEVFSGKTTDRKIDITGFYNEAGAPAINDAVSRLCNIALGPIGNARSDLDDVLDLNWYNNSFQLALEVLGIKLIDMDLYIDRGDVVLIKAFLKAAEGALYFLRGVDVTMDYEEVMSAAVDIYSDFVDADLDLISAFDLSPFSRLKIKSLADVQKARAAFAEAVALAKAGDALVQARTDGLNHLLQYERGGLSDVVQFILRHEQGLLAALDQFITPLQMSNAQIGSGVLELTYTGERLAPSIGDVTVGGTPVPYDVAGTTSAVEIGTYEMTLVGYGRSAGSKTVVWRVVEPPPSTVIFNLDGHGTRTGGGELEQLVAWKQAAIAPEFVSEAGYRFLGWDEKFDNVVGALTITAKWERLRYKIDIDGVVSDDCAYGREVTASTFASVAHGWTNIVCVGWAGTGDVPASGVGTQVTFTVTQPSTLRWLYATNYWVNVMAGAGGSVTLAGADGMSVPTQGWFGRETNLVAFATPDRGHRFVRWGEVVDDGEGGWTRVRTLSTQTNQRLRVSEPWNVRAEFAACEYAVDIDGQAPRAYAYGQEVTALTFASVTNGWTNIVCVGWAGTGDVPASGVGTQVTFTVTQPSTLRWLYATNYWVNVMAGAGGSVTLAGADGMALPVASWVPAGTNLSAEAVSDRGWTFAGWTDKTRGETLEAEPCVAWAVDSPRLLQAEFARNRFTVHYDANGGSGTMADQVFEYGIAQNPDGGSLTYPGLVLSGWARGSEDAAEFLTGAGISNLTEVADADMTLYAVWAPDSEHYKIAFCRGDGSGRMFDVACETNRVYALMANEFASPEGTRFAGWRCSNGKRYDDGVLFFNLALPSEIITMTAIWE